MDLRSLECFVAVAEEGSVSRAAVRLHMSQPPLSVRLQALERELGVRLLERTTRALSLTEIGREFFERAVGILASVEDAERAVQKAQGEPRGTLKLTCGVEFGMIAVSAWIDRYLARNIAVPLFGTLVLAAMLLPILTLVLGSLTVDGGWGLANYRALTTAGDNQALLVPVTTALATSLRTAVDATWMALLVGVVVAAIVTRRSHSVTERRVRSTLDGFFMLPLGVSAVTLGFGFLLTLGRPPLELRDNPLLVPVAQALIALPLVVRTLVPVLASVDALEIEQVIVAMDSAGMAAVRVAFVELRDDIQGNEMAEIMCRERGMTVRVFSQEALARRWLVYGD